MATWSAAFPGSAPGRDASARANLGLEPLDGGCVWAKIFNAGLKGLCVCDLLSDLAGHGAAYDEHAPAGDD